MPANKSGPKSGISLAGLILNPDGLMSMVEASFYDKVDHQAIQNSIRLQTGLNRYPSEWLDALCRALPLKNAGVKKEKIKAAAEHLLQHQSLSQVITNLSPLEQAALRDTLEAGGWVKYGTLSRRYGDEKPDSYFWTNRPPVSTIGRLRLHGLLFVGYMVIGGRRWKVAVVPVELRDPLREILHPDGR